MRFERDTSGTGPYPGTHPCGARDCNEDAAVAFLRYYDDTHRRGGGGFWSFRCAEHARGIRDTRRSYVARRFEAVP